MPAIQGAAMSVGMLLRRVAPRNAPTAPGRAMRRTTCQSTLPKRQWAAPAARVVPISARCTDAEAEAGAMPASSSRVVEVTP